MTDYTNISNVSVEPLAPVTSELMTSLRDNPIAIAEGAGGAPKIASKFTAGDTTAGGSGSGITFSGLAAYGGIIAHGSAVRTGAGDNITVAYSTDGLTYSTPTTFVSTQANIGTPWSLFLDFSTGQFFGLNGATPKITTGTVSGISNAVTHIRFSSTSSIIAVLLNPQGGQSAS